MRSATPLPAERAESTQLRLTFLALLVVSLFVLLVARLWYLQVLAGEDLAAQASGNALRSEVLEAPRGRILARDGRPLVRNRHAPVISVDPEGMGERREEVYAALAALLDLDPQEVARRAGAPRRGPFRPRPIAVDADPDVVSYLHERGHEDFPGVVVETLPLRDYPEGDLAAHVLGYLGEISEEELGTGDGYRPGDLLGRAGIEQVLEAELRGSDGVRHLAVDARGRVLRDLAESAAVPGADVVLTLDLDAQRLVEQALAEGLADARRLPDEGTGEGRGGTFAAPAGAAVVLDPVSGEVLAMASAPSFEPSAFVGGIGAEAWAALQDDKSHAPLLNRAVQAAYPPGSVYKVVTAAAALEEGYLRPGEALPCPAAWRWGEQTYRNWNPVDEAPMDLARSLVRSCDPVYYELARRMWVDEEAEGAAPRERLAQHSRAWGLGRPTGVDLPGERSGTVPSRAWKAEHWERTHEVTCRQADEAVPGSDRAALLADLCADGHRWRGGDSVNLSIGQGDLQATPLQVAVAFAGIANRGPLPVPHVTREVVGADGARTRPELGPRAVLPVSRAHLDHLHEGLVGVNQPGGTAAEAFAGFPVAVAGKTGTAEDRPRQPIAWYAGYAPAEAPRFVVVTMVEQGGGGGATAAPIARAIFGGLLGGDAPRAPASARGAPSGEPQVRR